MAPAASAEVVYGVTDTNKLVTIDSANPNAVSEPVPITGIAPGDSIKAIDVRPATLQLYALGAGGQLYKIDAVTGVATYVGVPLTLTGTDFDIDFNPTVDRLRVVSDGEQNLRVNPNTAAVTVDGALNPAGNVTGAAYTNSAPASAAFPAAPGTTLFDIDTGTDQLLTQTPPNNGTLTAGKALGVDLVGDVGFDISTAAASLGGVGANTAYVVGRTADANDRLYGVDLATGAATSVGELAGTDKIKDIAVAPPLPQLAVLYTPALPVDPQQIVTVRADRPGAANAPVNVTGLQSGERLLGIDRRPSTGVVFGFGSTGRLYTLNLATGAATQVGAGAIPTPGTSYGFDFNPSVDRIRLNSDADSNLRLNPADGAVTTDTNLQYAAGDPNAGADPNVTAAGYTPTTPLGVPATPGGATTLFDVDTTLDVLTTQAPPNNGTLNTVVNPSGTNGLGVNVTDANGFDIAARFNHEFGAFTPTGVTGAPTLYAVNASSTAPVAPAVLGPANGTAVAIGALGGRPTAGTIAGMTIVNDDIAPAAPTATPTPTPTTTPAPTVTTVPTVTPTATPAPYAIKKRPGLTGKVRPKRDRKKPFRFRVSGSLKRPSGVSKAKACKGTVRITVKRGKKTLAKTTTKVRSSCAYSKRIKLNGKKAGKRGTARFSISFRGNGALLTKTITRKAKYGPKR